MRLALLASVGLASVMLAGCGANSGASIDNFITTMSKTNCHVTLTMAATVGAVNPGSGAQFQAQADCPNGIQIGPPVTRAPAPLIDTSPGIAPVSAAAP